jgi:hypothetical protein
MMEGCYGWGRVYCTFLRARTHAARCTLVLSRCFRPPFCSTATWYSRAGDGLRPQTSRQATPGPCGPQSCCRDLRSLRQHFSTPHCSVVPGSRREQASYTCRRPERTVEAQQGHLVVPPQWYSQPADLACLLGGAVTCALRRDCSALVPSMQEINSIMLRFCRSHFKLCF